ncbi:MAG TPA: hypothetical protein VFO60_11670, partial [Candidatus Dormibacteraeota bacterium]|nr:hypothetical protein [Candidatus Dormibacteraeota bacterium]
MRRMHLAAVTGAALAASISLAGFGVAHAIAPAPAAAPSAASTASTTGAGSGVHFELNQGQTDRRVNFIVRGAGNPVFITPAEMTVVLTQPPVVSSGGGSATPTARTASGSRSSSQPDQSTATVTGAVLRLQLANANPNPQVTGEGLLGGVSNYMRGKDPSRWVTGVHSYAQVRYHDVYPGIDLVYHAGASGGVEYDFVVAAGADASAIGIDVRGAAAISAGGEGGLVV